MGMSAARAPINDCARHTVPLHEHYSVLHQSVCWVCWSCYAEGIVYQDASKYEFIVLLLPPL
jgi:hypothetical protein